MATVKCPIIRLNTARRSIVFICGSSIFASKNTMTMLMNILTLAGALGMFLYGMNMMSAGLQKAAGSSLRNLLGKMTSNPLKGVLTGFGVTAVIQSSSATTVMVVGFVSAGLLTLAQSIGVIMGANIGTTMTAWIISIFGFKADISVLSVPLMGLGFVLSLSKRDKLRNISELVMGFALLFLGLSLMKSSVPDLKSSPETLAFIADWSGRGFISVLLFLGLGTILTLILQSSSATVALTLIMLNMGWIQFDMAAAMVLGENVGTTITANIAASIGSINAKRAALAHTIFNLFGVCWALAVFNPFVRFIQWVVSLMDVDASVSTVYGISMLHTIFNLINTMIMIWFTRQIEKIVKGVIREKTGSVSVSEPKIRYIDYGLVSTPELALTEAIRETIHFGEIMKNGLEYVQKAIHYSDDAEKTDYYRGKLVKYEEISDKIEYEIVKFVGELDKDGLSEASKAKIRALIRISGELESLGDSGEAISRSILHMNAYGRKLAPAHIAKLEHMTGLLSDACEEMIFNLEHHATIKDIRGAELNERRINEDRDECRAEVLDILDNVGESYFETVFYLNILEELEKMGDFIINISQALIR